MDSLRKMISTYSEEKSQRCSKKIKTAQKEKEAPKYCHTPKYSYDDSYEDSSSVLKGWRRCEHDFGEYVLHSDFETCIKCGFEREI